MKIKLEEAILLQSSSSTQFMIAEYVEIHHELATVQMSYHGKIYNYDNYEPSHAYDGEWVYDLSINLERDKED